MKITGYLIEAYVFCQRQAWLMSHQISGNKDNEHLIIGRLISDNTYKRDKKEIDIKNGKIDIIRKNKDMVIIEVKKSNKFLESAKMQLLYYLLKMHQKGFKVTGEIHIPKTKKIIPVRLDKKNKKIIETLLIDIENFINQTHSPEYKFSPKCPKCSYFEFCWA